MRKSLCALVVLLLAFRLNAQSFNGRLVRRGLTIAPGNGDITTDGGPHEWDNMVTYLPLDEGTGINAVDFLGNFNGTLQNTPAWTTGIAGSAVTLTGSSSQRISFSAPFWANLNSFAFCIWLKFTATGTMMAYGEGNTGSLNPRMFIDVNDGATGNVGFGMLDDAGTDGFFTTAALSLNDGSWHYVCVNQYDKSTRDIFTDGVWRASKRNVTLGTCTPTTSNVGVMQNNAFNNYFTGNVDGPRWWNQAQSTAAFLLLYNQQK